MINSNFLLPTEAIWKWLPLGLSQSWLLLAKEARAQDIPFYHLRRTSDRNTVDVPLPTLWSYDRHHWGMLAFFPSPREGLDLLENRPPLLETWEGKGAQSLGSKLSCWLTAKKLQYSDKIKSTYRGNSKFPKGANWVLKTRNKRCLRRA